MGLFQRGEFHLASGLISHFKIECDVLDDDDWETLAGLIVPRVPRFVLAIGIPTGGDKLAKALAKYRSHTGVALFVDDVWTTGKSMKKFMTDAGVEPGTRGIHAAVAFARGPHPDWVTPLFTIDEFQEI